MRYGVEVLTTKYHRTTLPCLPGHRDTEERGYTIRQLTMEALLAVLLTVMGDFHCHPRVVRILRRSCRITPQSNSPMPVLPTMQSDDVRQENMATVLNINIPLKCFKRKRVIHSTIAELQVSMAVYFLYRNSANDDL